METDGQDHFAASPDDDLDGGSGRPGSSSVHKRTYQACLPCRRRKVRCDLGSVDEPGDPPCLRCRREKKDCTFSETRRKRKADDEGGELDADFVARNKRSSIGLSAPREDGFGDGHSVGGIQVNEEESGTTDEHEDGGEQQRREQKNRDVANETAAALFRQPITQPGDALRMLVDAASHTESEGRKESTAHAAEAAAAAAAARPRTAPTTQIDADGSATNIDPALVGHDADLSNGAAPAALRAPQDLAAALQAWTTLRFVQAGWFTAREAIGYIDYFYEHLAPLTPISPPDFRSYASHARLLVEEPMLTVTMLTTASRYKKLAGPGGETRTFRLHDKLWEYLQAMITRMFWGQEQFGGGFCGAGAAKTMGDPEMRKRGLRSLGTVESLLLLSDWMPRSMHFPPGDDAGELTVPLSGTMEVDEQPNSHAGWTEPAIRSDRMVWSLVGMAYTLSWELGVFDSLVESKKWSPGPQEKTSYDPERADRCGRMLLVYVSQACGRLGYPNMMPGQGNETNFNFLKMDVPPGTFPGPYAAISAEDRVQRAWAELTALMRQSNTEMFDSKQFTHASIQNGDYVTFLEAWGPRLRDWKERFDQTEIAPKARTILLIEYEYTRTYINSLALQAVVESCTTGTDETSPAGAHSAHTPPALLSSKHADVHKRNRGYIDELVESARSVLRLVVTDLLPSGALRHSPVRTHFRVLSAAMFLLKSFALGAKESEVQVSMALLDRTIAAMRRAVIDDVHLSLRIAELLHGLAATIRRKFVRLAVPSARGGKPRAGKGGTSAPKGANASERKSSARAQQQQQQQQAQHAANRAVANGANASLASVNAATGYSSFNLTPTDEFYSLLSGGDLAPTLVDLKDPSITIMPPPDFIGQFDITSGYPPLSPHSSTGAPVSGEQSSPTIGARATTAAAQRTNSLGAGQAAPFSPAAGSGPQSGQGQVFSPLSTNSGGYDWLALDFNGLLQQNAMGYHSPHPGHVQPSGYQSGSGVKHEGGGQEAEMEEEAGERAANNPWASGAFGPEISEGLEFMSALGAIGNDDWGVGGSGGMGGTGW